MFTKIGTNQGNIIKINPANVESIIMTLLDTFIHNAYYEDNLPQQPSYINNETVSLLLIRFIHELFFMSSLLNSTKYFVLYNA